MTLVSCLIVDDEPIAREILTTFIAQDTRLTLSGSCADAHDAFVHLQNHTVDILFLDINIGSISGIDLLRSLPTPPLCIFTTAYREYAVEGFDLNIVDFLHKPFAFSRFLLSVNKALPLLPRKNVDIQDYLFIKENGRKIRIWFDQILYIEAFQEYIKIVGEDFKHLAYMRMKEIEGLLPENNFYRIHRSFIVNIHKVKVIEDRAIHFQDAYIPIGAAYYTNFLNKLKISGS